MFAEMKALVYADIEHLLLAIFPRYTAFFIRLTLSAFQFLSCCNWVVAKLESIWRKQQYPVRKLPFMPKSETDIRLKFSFSPCTWVLFIIRILTERVKVRDLWTNLSRYRYFYSRFTSLQRDSTDLIVSSNLCLFLLVKHASFKSNSWVYIAAEVQNCYFCRRFTWQKRIDDVVKIKKKISSIFFTYEMLYEGELFRPIHSIAR